MKTYFNYEGTIRSKEVAEAIGFPSGMGPFMGFGSASISSSSITLGPEADTDSIYYNDIKDRNLVRGINMSNESQAPKFGLINRTGHIYVSTEQNINVTIDGTKGSYNEVIVFAVFQYVEAAVEMVPTFKAFWNTGESFYQYYKNSLSLGYDSSSREITEPWKNQKYNYNALVDKVKGSCSWYGETKTAILIGIYGTGVNEEGAEENFAIVPYNGQFPQSIPFNPSYYTPLLNKLNYINTWVFKNINTDTYPSLINLVESLIKNQQDSPGIVPVGGIIMWSGTEIPDNYHLCDGTNGTPDLSGKFVVGKGGAPFDKLGATGGSSEVTLTLKHLPEHKHKINFASYKWGDNADLRPFPTNASRTTSTENEVQDVYTQPTGEANPTPINTLPPYYVLAYIMRIK